MLMLAVLLAVVPAQADRAADEALMAVAPMRVPGFGETDVARNAAFISMEQLTGVSVITFEGTAEVETPATVEVVEGITIAALPLQPALSNVNLRLSFIGGFTEDVSWTTGSALIEPPATAADITRAEVVRPLMESPRVDIEIAPNANRAAAVLSSIDGDQRTRLSAAVTMGATSRMFFSDWGYRGGARDYQVLAIDRAGNVAEGVTVTVSDVGCAATPAAPAGALALLLLALRGGYTRKRWASSIAG